MDIKNLIKEEDRKKFLIITLVVFLIIIGAVFFLLSRPSTPPTDNNQLLSDLASLEPRDTASTRTLEKLPTIELHTDKTELAPGQSATISWSASNAVNCVDRNGDTLDLSGTLSISPNEPYTFDISCTGPNGTEIQSVTIAVTSAPIINLSASPSSVFSGGTAVISWDTTNADRCTMDNGNTLRLSDNLSVSPKSSYTFSMSCVGQKGTTKKSITVPVKARPLATNTIDTTDKVTSGSTSVTPPRTIASFFSNVPSTVGGLLSGVLGGTTKNNKLPEITLTATPENIPYDGTTLIKWTIANATYCLFTSTGSLGNIPPIAYSSGSRTTSKLTATQTYTLSCSKDAGLTEKSVTVTVGDRPIPGAPVFTTPFKVTTGHYVGKSEQFIGTFDNLTFSWATKDAKNCALKKNDVVMAGKSTLGPNTNTTIQTGGTAGKFIYTLTCTGESGTITSAPITVHVVNCTIEPNTLGPDNTATEGLVKPGSDYGFPGAACIYVYGDPQGSASDFSRIFGFSSAVLYGTRYSGTNVLPTGVAGMFNIQAAYNGNNSAPLCKYTYYTEKPDSAGTGVIHGSWRDTTKHPDWEYLGSTADTFQTDCRGRQLHGAVEYINGDYYEYPANDSGRFFACGDLINPGISGYSIMGINSLTCLVSVSDPEAKAQAEALAREEAARARAKDLEICLTVQAVATTSMEPVQTCITRAPAPTWSDPFRTVCITYGMVLQEVTHPGSETVASCNSKYGPL